MPVLVAAASRHGGTAEIAERIGADLAGRGLDVKVASLDDVGELDAYDAFVVGSGVYFGNWLPAARDFVHAHASELAAHPTWLFASGSIVGDPPVADDPNALRAGLADRLVGATHAHEHQLFGGKLDRSKLSFCERIAVRCAHAADGDFRDWQEVDAWAAGIARELEARAGAA
jgi:menaquinone-dependent protoporphyrinogen oxidase